MPNPKLPVEFTGLKQVTETPKKAVGIPGILASVKHVFGAMPIARGFGVLKNLNQKGGIDCPSCAWPDPDGKRSALGEFCENGAKAIADEATSKKITLPFFQRYSVDELSDKSDYWLGNQGRLSSPMVIMPGDSHYKKIDWEEAFELVAKELNSLNDPNEAIFYTSGRSSNEAAFLYQLFVRAFGTNNLPDCSNMCHESSGVALSKTLGIGKGSVTLDDFDKADLIVIMGQNPGTNHPRMLSSLEKAKENGAKIVAINPLYEAGLLGFKNPQSVKGLLGNGTSIADLYLQIKINGDLALLKVLNHLLTKAEEAQPGMILNREFINQNTQGYEAFLQESSQININELVADTQLPFAEIQAFLDLIISSKKIIVCWAMGLTQHKNSVATIQEVVNLLLLKGSIGIEGGGTCPVRGHSNVQGDRTVGIMHKPSAQLNAALQANFGFTPPQDSGYDVVEAIHAMYTNKAKVFFALGGNFLSASPDTEYTAKALQNCNLTVHVSTKLNRSHLIHGKVGLILPCLGRTDLDEINGQAQYVSTENSMGVVQKSQGILKPVSEFLLSEPSIIAKLAKATLGNKFAIDWYIFASDYMAIRKSISKTISGFKDYETKLQQDGGFYLPNGPRIGEFTTKAGKALFTINKYSKIALKPEEFLMMTIRSHDQFNTTVYGLNDRYRGIFNERRIVFMNKEDMDTFGFETYEKVNLINDFGMKTRIAERFIVVPYSIPKSCVATYFPEANVLVPIDSMADESQTPTSKSVIIRIEKLNQAECL
jgi:molybdopterin-dependent oxidoreductase alpha subunit